MTTKGQRRLASWQARHVLALGFEDQPEMAKVDGADKLQSQNDMSELVNEESSVKKRKMVRKFNAFESTDSELDFEDDVFSEKLVDLIKRDFSRMNLQLLKGLIMKPQMKQHKKESDHWVEGPEEIPVALEEIMLR